MERHSYKQRANAYIKNMIFFFEMSGTRSHCKGCVAGLKGLQHTLQPLYNTVRYNAVLDITRFKDGSQKCIDYIEK